MEPEELVRRLFDAFNKRDVDAMLALVTADSEVVLGVGAVADENRFAGRGGVEGLFESLDDVWTEFRVDPGELTVRGDRVLSLGLAYARARATDVVFDGQEVAAIIDVRGGKVARLESYLTYERAQAVFEGDG